MSEGSKDMFCQPSYERALLGFCFKSINNFYAIRSVINSEDFLRADHKLIYMLFMTLDKRNVTHFDSGLIISEAQKNGVLTDIGGYEYIHAIEDFVITSNNLQFYIDKVLDSSAKYQLYAALLGRLNALEDEAVNDDAKAGDLIDAAESVVLDVSLKSKAVKEATNLSEGIDEYIDYKQNNPTSMCGLSTGFPIFDRQIDGLIKGTLTVVAARAKCGKSTFLASVASHVAYERLGSVLYIDTEMNFNQFRDRLISVLSGVPELIVRHGGYNSQERHNIDQAVKVIKKGRLFHEYCPGYTVDKVKALYRKYKHREDIEIGIFDYIKAPSSSDFASKKEYQILGDVTTALKDMAGILDIPLLAATQVNRNQDVADSDRILRYADVLSFIKPKTSDEIVGEGGIDYGTHRLVITASRRGGSTPSEGIGLTFIGKALQLFESKCQFVDFYNNNNNLHERDSMVFGGSHSEPVGAVIKNDEFENLF